MTTTATTRRVMDEMLTAGMQRCSPEDEQALIGAMLIATPQSGIPAAIRDKLTPRNTDNGNGSHHFAVPAHVRIWTTIVELMDDGEPHDAITVGVRMGPEALQQVGGFPYLHTCMEACPSVANGLAYARDVVGATLLRDIAKLASQATERVLRSSLHEARDTYEDVGALLAGIEIPLDSDGPVAWSKTSDELNDEIERLEQVAKEPALGVAEFSTGWHDLDRLLAPVVPGAMIIIAGRPGMSKTTAAVNIAQHLAMEKGLPVLFFSMEMSRTEIGLKTLCCRTKVPGQTIKEGTLSDEQWLTLGRKLGEDAGAPFDIDDTAGISTDYIDRELAAHVRRHGRAPAAFFVDHIGLVEERGGKDTREKTELISRRLKLLAKKYGTVCIALSQLNRGPENRTGGIPQLSDLRNSGSIEQDADIVILLHREDYYDKESPRAGEIDFIVAKHRNGPTDTIELAALLHISKISSMAIA